MTLYKTYLSTTCFLKFNSMSCKSIDIFTYTSSQSPIYGHIGYFLFFTITNKGIANILEQASLCVCVNYSVGRY